MESKLLLLGVVLIIVYTLGIYLIVKNQIKINKSKTFVRRVPIEGTIQELFFQGYCWIYNPNLSKAMPGVLVYYYEENSPIRISIPEEYFNSKYISLIEKEKEDKK